MKKNDGIEISLLAVILILLFGINYMLMVPLVALFITIIGSVIYTTLSHINAEYCTISCDYIQTGEATVGSFAILIVAKYMNPDSYLVFLAAFISILLYAIYLKSVVSPEKNETAIHGLFVHAIPAIIIAYLAISDTAPQARIFEKLAFGYLTSIKNSYIGALAASGLGIAAMMLCLACNPELRLFSLGKSFFSGSRSTRTIIAICIAVLRSLLVTATVATVGWMCGFGLYARRLVRGNYPNIKTALILSVYTQFIILITRYTPPLYVIAASVCLSYLAFFYQSKKWIYLYDRY